MNLPASLLSRSATRQRASLDAFIRCSLVILAFLVLPLELAAQAEGYKFSRVRPEEGHINNQVNCILKDSRGFMWFGTNAGLNRYNGYALEVFQHAAGDTSSLSADFIVNLAEDPQGYIWVFTQQGIDLYDPTTETFLRDPAPFLKKYGLPDAHISHTLKGRRGHYWFVHSEKGLFRYAPRQGRTTRLAHAAGDSRSLADNRIAAFAEDKSGHFWVMHDTGILEKLDGHSGRVTYRNRDLQQLSGREARPYVIFPDADGDLWVYVTQDDNGREGWQQVLALLPDLVVSDVAMPEMDGVALCRKIKAHTRSSHIPVMLLTANSSEEQVLEGFKTGANDYITKPFNVEILQSRIRNLVMWQESIRQSFQQYLEVNPQEISITPLDEKFILSAIGLVEQNMDNPDFSVEDMGRQLGLSRTSLYKKIVALTGTSPLEFIRVLRLKRAAQLLLESQLSVSEIAAEVGFNTVKYFTKYFKEEFNYLPSAYARKKKNEQKN